MRAARSAATLLLIASFSFPATLRPLDTKAHHNLGVCLDALGEKAAALCCFEKAFELDPRMADSGANAAGLLLRTGEAQRACALCYLVSYSRFPPSCVLPSRV